MLSHFLKRTVLSFPSKPLPISPGLLLTRHRYLSGIGATTPLGTNKVAVVTGASRGIGRAIALRLAKDGYDVSVNDLPSAKSQLEDVVSTIVNETGRRAFACMGDVSKEEDVKALVSDTVDALGSVDVMVANAGYCFMKPLFEVPVEEWDKIFSINVRGAFLSYKYAAEQMVKQGRGGRIIGASSIAGKKGEGLLSGYSSTKFAVRGLTQAAAQEWAQHGITVNAYAPGPIDTFMLKVITQSDPVSESEQVVNVGNVMNRAGTPQDVAGLVSYLASEESGFMTGQALTIDGGRCYD